MSTLQGAREVALQHTNHSGSVHSDVASLVADLEQVLGKPVIILIAELDDARTIDAWKHGRRCPPPIMEARLRQAAQIVDVLREADSAETVRLWFTGMNPDLDDQPP